MRACLAAVLLVAACSGKGSQPQLPHPTNGSGSAVALPTVDAPPPTPPTPTPAGVKVSLADVGLEAASLDRSADACVDFYQLACGGWLANTKIPDDRARWGRFSEIDEKNKAALRTILEDAAKATDPASKKLGDAYTSCMDEAAIESAGTKPLKAIFDAAKGVKDAKTWFAALTMFHRYNDFVVFDVTAAADQKDSTTNVTTFESGELGLPDRDYYVKPEFAAKLATYKEHVVKSLVLAGFTPERAATGAEDVRAIEVALATATKTGVEKRDVQAAYNAMDQAALAKLVKSIDWAAYWKAVGYTPSKRIVVGTPKYLALIDGWRKQFTPAQWASYFTYRVANDFAFELPKAFDDEAFALTKALTGAEKQPERSKRCVDATTGMLAELLGKVYVDKQFPAKSKDTAIGLVDQIIAVMGGQIDKLPWMTEATRKIAHDKLAKIVRMVGYPDKWKTYDFDVKRDDFAGNMLRAIAFDTKRQLAKSGKPVDRGEWQMNSFTVNAYYEPTANNTALPAGILQPPFFGQDRQIAANLGGIGMVIGHELTHGFDDQGAQYDAAGNLKDWWSADDKRMFDTRTSCVADQYSTFEVLPKQFINGRLTLGENVADLGGVKMAFEAYRAMRATAEQHYVADGFTEDQQFFLAVGQAWCGKDRKDETQRRLTVDVHSPPKFRVYGALRNLPEFATAFSCAAGTPMRPANSCSVW